jgi:predicted metal-dependent hydrolase
MNAGGKKGIERWIPHFSYEPVTITHHLLVDDLEERWMRDPACLMKHFARVVDFVSFT